VLKPLILPADARAVSKCNTVVSGSQIVQSCELPKKVACISRIAESFTVLTPENVNLPHLPFVMMVGKRLLFVGATT